MAKAKTKMCLLVAVESSSSKSLGAQINNSVIGPCEADRCESRVAELKAQRDPRLRWKDYVWVISLPESGMINPGENLEIYIIPLW